MAHRIGLRREDMYAWERRTPLVPEDLRRLAEEEGLEIVVQSSDKRAFGDQEYREAGLPVSDTLAECPVIVGLKEVPAHVFEDEKVYVYFSHTIKGQSANMPLLRTALQRRCTILDYERIVDENNRRLIFFGNYAGLAGMIDTLWTLGRRLLWEGIETPLAAIEQASHYADLDEAKEAVRAVGRQIAAKGLPDGLDPLVIGIAGYGNVSKGAQEILDLLPVTTCTPADLLSGTVSAEPGRSVVKVVFTEEDTVLPVESGHAFDLHEYYEYPERYRAAFSRYLGAMHALVNCIYWEPKYPRLVTRADIRGLYDGDQPTLRVIGDISCDVEGGVEVTVKATEPDDPVYVYDVATGDPLSGVKGQGPVVMAVDILPSELPREASTYFSGILRAYVPAIAAADYTVSFDALDLPPELKRAVIAYRGSLTPGYEGLAEYLKAA